MKKFDFSSCATYFHFGSVIVDIRTFSLKTFCNQNGWGFVDHSNISPEHDLNRSGLHLNTKGTARLATNFINYLRDD